MHHSKAEEKKMPLSVQVTFMSWVNTFRTFRGKIWTTAFKYVKGYLLEQWKLCRSISNKMKMRELELIFGWKKLEAILSAVACRCRQKASDRVNTP
jgi:hypothetical protein